MSNVSKPATAAEWKQAWHDLIDYIDDADVLCGMHVFMTGGNDMDAEKLFDKPNSTELENLNKRFHDLMARSTSGEDSEFDEDE